MMMIMTLVLTLMLMLMLIDGVDGDAVMMVMMMIS